MKETMRALRKLERGPGNLRLIDVAVPEPGTAEVRIAVEAAGVCGTDLHIAHDTYTNSPPMTLGHEFSGRVDAVGSQVTDLQCGDRVMCEPMAYCCERCPLCRRGQTHLCEERKAYGVQLDGGFAEHVVVRQGAVHRLPTNVDYVAGAMTEPLAVCVHALTERTHISPGQLVLVIGPAPVGLLAAMLAKAHGASVVVAGTHRDVHRLELARCVGADKTVDVDTTDLGEEVRRLSGAEGGADITVEAAGASQAVDASYHATRRGGTIVQLGLFDADVQVDYSLTALRELTVIGSFAHSSRSFERALELMDQQRIDVKALVAEIVPLAEWERGFQLAEAKNGAKVILTPR